MIVFIYILCITEKFICAYTPSLPIIPNHGLYSTNTHTPSSPLVLETKPTVRLTLQLSYPSRPNNGEPQYVNGSSRGRVSSPPLPNGS